MKVTAPLRIDISGGWPDSNPYRAKYGGEVLNIAINHRVSAELKDDNLITSMEGIPPNSGLGTSGALRSCYLVASNPELINDLDSLITKVFLFENLILKHKAGVQDQAAAVYGGGNLWNFSSGTIPIIKRTRINEDRLNHLEERIALIYTGMHDSSDMHSKVFKNPENQISKLFRMKELAREMYSDLEDTQKMIQHISETWLLQRLLSPRIETEKMRELQDKMRGDYFACKACGAGGGGVMMFYTETPKKFEKVKGYIPFKFDREGIKIDS